MLKEHMALLGYRVRDYVTGFEGVVASITFDLYGCVQAIVNPGLDEKGEPRESRWFDIARLARLSDVPVMPVPDYEGVPRSEAATRGEKGPAERPMGGMKA